MVLSIHDALIKAYDRCLDSEYLSLSKIPSEIMKRLEIAWIGTEF